MPSCSVINHSFILDLIMDDRANIACLTKAWIGIFVYISDFELFEAFVM